LDENQATGALGLFGGGGGGGAPTLAERYEINKAATDAQALREAAEQKRREAEEKKQQAAEERRKAAEQQAQARRQAAEENRVEAEQKRAQAARAKQAQASVEKAKPRATFSLANLFGGLDENNEKDDSSASTGEAPSRPPVQPKKIASPPRGTPVISDWKQNRDGSITGRISGGAGFKEGEKITTSPIGGKALDGSLVQTSSGSR
jgi:hypothetical protein